MKKVRYSRKAAKVAILAAASTAMLFAASCSSDSSSDDDYTPSSVTTDSNSNNSTDSTDDDSGNPSNPSIPENPSNPSSPSGPTYGNNSSATSGTGSAITTPTAEVPQNATVQIVKSEGWLNSAYIVFEQIEGATYEVYCDDVKIDDELIRYYDTYTYSEQSEDADLQVKYTKQTLNKVVRADAMGVKAGSHTMKVCAVGTNGKTEFSSATMTVADHDRQGFAFTGTDTPGAYNKDGTLKAGTVVIYVTEANKNSVKATIGKAGELTGMADITQAIKTKNMNKVPVCIRIVGQVNGYDAFKSSDMSSAYALGVKDASYVTIEGVGDDATLKGAGVAAFKSDYIEIANLGLVNWGGGHDGDGVSLKEDHYVWVHNNDYFYGDAGGDGDQAKGDGSMDLKDDSQYITVSYNHFWDSGKMSLCGMHSETGDNWITYHHNWFDHSDSRHPRIRRMSVHVYNNYFDGNAKYGVGVTSGGNAFVEGNFFRDAHDPMLISMQGTDSDGDGTFSSEEGGQIKAFNNKYVQNGKYMKFQFRTNKMNYTTGQAYTNEGMKTEELGTASSKGFGTYELYSGSVNKDSDSIGTCNFISKLGAAEKTSTSGSKYYQTSKGKDCFSLKVPENQEVTVVVKGKAASSGATSAKLSIGGTSLTFTADYTDVVAKVTSSDGRVVIKNADGSSSINITDIAVYSDSKWTTTYSTGCDLSDIDAYEVDTRNELVPTTVVSKSGSFKYSNFDTTKGDAGLGLTSIPTDADQAKADVMMYAGRHNSDLKWDFNNAEDDAKYSVDTSLKTMLNNYKTGMTAIQGTSSGSSDNNSGNTGDTGNTDDNGGTTGGNTDSTPTPTPVAGNSFAITGAGSFTTDFGTVVVTGSLKAGIAAKTYAGTTYTTALKMETATSIKITTSSAVTVKVVTDTASKNIKLAGVKVATDSDGIATLSLTAGANEITKGDSMNVYAIIAQ